MTRDPAGVLPIAQWTEAQLRGRAERLRRLIASARHAGDEAALRAGLDGVRAELRRRGLGRPRTG